MKKILIILSLCVAFQGISANDLDSLVVAGNEHYMNGEFELAIDKYQQVIDSGFVSSELYYNLGNAFFKSHKLTMALVQYERAKLLDPDDNEINHNLEMARQYVVDEIDVLPEWQLKKWFRRIVGIVSVDNWAITSILTFILMLGLLLVFLFSGRLMLRKISFGLSVFLLVISLTAFLFASHQKKMVYDNNYAIIISPSVTIKSSPDESGTELFQLHEGTRITIVDELAGWREIKLADGNVGWLKEEDIIPL